jgi:hypothetical protein
MNWKEPRSPKLETVYMLRTLAEPHYNERVHECESLEILKKMHI